MMSDDLVKRLRGFPPNVHETMTEAADRIAALEAAVTQCRTLSAMLKPQADRIAELEAALRSIVEYCDDPYIPYYHDILSKACAALEGKK
jgi:hypothetical protein